MAGKPVPVEGVQTALRMALGRSGVSKRNAWTDTQNDDRTDHPRPSDIACSAVVLDVALDTR